MLTMWSRIQLNLSYGFREAVQLQRQTRGYLMSSCSQGQSKGLSSGRLHCKAQLWRRGAELVEVTGSSACGFSVCSQLGRLGAVYLLGVVPRAAQPMWVL